MSVWSHCILEVYCTFSWASEKQHKMYSYNSKDFLSDGFLKKGKPTIRKNDHYVSPKLRPKWCIRKNKKFVPQFSCFCYGKKNDKCPFLAFTEADRKDKDIMMGAWWKKRNEVKND